MLRGKPGITAAATLPQQAGDGQDASLLAFYSSVDASNREQKVLSFAFML